MRLAQAAARILTHCLVLTTTAVVLTATASAQHYEKTNLVSDLVGVAQNTDPDLVNPWGLARSSVSPWWVSDNATDKSTLYNGAGAKVPLVVNAPRRPTGVVFNGSDDFEIAPDQPARFLFVTESGTILGWNGGADTHLVAATPGAIYKGVAIASWAGKRYLYAVDFHSGQIDVFDSKFQRVSSAERQKGEIGDFKFVGRLHGLVPFNVQNIGNTLYVAFARQDGTGEDEIHGAGLGRIAAFTPGGRLIRIFEHVDALNAPWGLALAPGDFGTFSHHLLVAQFGSGEILAFNISTGNFAGKVLEPDGTVMRIDGLWGLGFGNDATAGPATTLFFTAGPDDEEHGLFGSIVPVPTEQEGNTN